MEKTTFNSFKKPLLHAFSKEVGSGEDSWVLLSVVVNGKSKWVACQAIDLPRKMRTIEGGRRKTSSEGIKRECHVG